MDESWTRRDELLASSVELLTGAKVRRPGTPAPQQMSSAPMPGAKRATLEDMKSIADFFGRN